MSVQSTQILALEAFEHVKPEMCAEYEAAGVTIDNRVKETEPGMLVHALTKVTETSDEAVYRWLEVFDSPAALEAHFNSPHVQAHVAMLNDTMLTEPTEIVLYTGWSGDEKAAWLDAHPGANVRFAPILASFFLDR